MTYQIQRMYYKNTNQTRVKLYQERPLREFEVMLDGDLGKLGDFQIEDMAKKELAKEFNPNAELETIRKELDEQKDLANKVFNTIVLNDATDEQKEALLEGKRVWVVGEVYNGGEIIQHKGVLYEVIKYHLSQANGEPGTIGGASLYKLTLNLKLNEVEVISDFVKPTGAHDAYAKGDKVRFEGKIYVSKVDGNAYSPTEAPENWELIEG